MKNNINRNPLDLLFAIVSFISAAFVVLAIVGIFIILVKESLPAIHQFGIFHFLISTEWDPVQHHFGAATNIYGTLLTTLLSLLVAIPVSIGIAVFVTEIAPTSIRGAISVSVELLAAIPSIIYGMWGLFTLAPIMGQHVEPVLQSFFGHIPGLRILFDGTPMGIDLLTASLILGIMIIPFTASIARDAFRLTPDIVKESAYAVGATRWEVVRDVVIPYSRLGVFGGVILSLGRALGETMAVAFVLGNNHQITTSLFDAAATITVTLANEFAEAEGKIYYSSLFYLALVLFVMSFITLALARFFLFRAERKSSR